VLRAANEKGWMDSVCSSCNLSSSLFAVTLRVKAGSWSTS
jgi:hypothetical protein